MTYNELKQYLKDFSEEQLNQNVTIYLKNIDEYYGQNITLKITKVDDVLDSNHYYLQLDQKGKIVMFQYAVAKIIEIKNDCPVIPVLKIIKRGSFKSIYPQIIFRCPGCGQIHTHSEGEGHRQPHCYKENDLTKNGYYIKYINFDEDISQAGHIPKNVKLDPRYYTSNNIVKTFPTKRNVSKQLGVSKDGIPIFAVIRDTMEGLHLRCPYCKKVHTVAATNNCEFGKRDGRIKLHCVYDADYVYIDIQEVKDGSAGNIPKKNCRPYDWEKNKKNY